jgi:ubiquinone/menaquinone biosynthesis C-methylase UbiE
MSEPEAFKTLISGVFSRAASTYDRTGPRFFSHFGRGLVEFARIPPGARVLDVACGRGAVFVPASAAVGGLGEVIGIDFSEGMVEQARDEIARQGLTNTSIRAMDAENLEFPDASFDFVLCGLCLHFLPNLDQALAGFSRVLKPGGYLVTSTFRAHDDATTRRRNALMSKYKDRLKPAPTAETRDLDHAADIRQAMAQAGFSEVEIAEDEATFYFSSPEEWWNALWSHAVRRVFERMDPDVLAGYREEALAMVAEEMTGQGIPGTWYMYYSRSRKPA